MSFFKNQYEVYQGILNQLEAGETFLGNARKKCSTIIQSGEKMLRGKRFQVLGVKLLFLLWISFPID